MKKIYGLTGGIASGKSLVSDFLIKEGIQIIDCDKIVRNLENDEDYITSLKLNFTDDIFCLNNKLNRVKLAEIIFNDEEKRKVLNMITHPRVFQQIEDEIRESKNDIIVISMPLLFETEYERCSQIICVYSDMKTRIKRLISRDKISEDYAIKKIKSQLDIEIKKEKSTYVIDNSKDILNTKIQVMELVKKL